MHCLLLLKLLLFVSFLKNATESWEFSELNFEQMHQSFVQEVKLDR
jgi:hypothetical protein